MNEIEAQRHVVIPQWLPFGKAASQREAREFIGQPKVIDFAAAVKDFQDELVDFKSDPAPFFGSELMGIAFANGSGAEAKELAEYVITEPITGPVAIRQAMGILGRATPTAIEDERAKLRRLRGSLKQYPRDAIASIEQARIYTIFGLREKARKAVMVALHIAPSNRFVVRAAIRFFIHFEEWDSALRYANTGFKLSNDPLIFAPLLSVATYLNKLPFSIKPIAAKALASENAFLYSEALEAFGTLEIESGADKRSRPFFKQAWLDPAKAVISHSQWVLRERLPGLRKEQNIDFTKSSEALSWLHLWILDFEGAIRCTWDWALEEPYSRAPYILGSSIASMLEKHDVAIDFAKRGRIANPKDEVLINNQAFAQLRSGDVTGGEATFSSIRHLLTEAEQIAPLATYGLLLMAKGRISDGQKQYTEAIRRAAEGGNTKLEMRASLNFLISLLDICKAIEPETLSLAATALDSIQDPISLGTSMEIVKRLKKLSIADEAKLLPAIQSFIHVTEKKRLEFIESAFFKGVKSSSPGSLQ